MQRFLTWLIMLALVVGVGGFFAAPGYSFFSLRSAAQAKDVQGLAQLVDFDAVRASLRPQLSGRPEPTTPPPSILSDPIGALRRQFEQARPVPSVDGFLTPEAIAGLTDGEGRLASQRSREAAQVPPTAEGAFRAPWPKPRYWGPNRVRMSVVDQGGSETLFTWQRKTIFGWKLVQIGLPDGTDPEPAETSTVPARP